MKLIFLFLLSSFSLFAELAIGEVVEIIGNASSISPQNEERSLEPGSKIFVKDTVSTKSESAIRIKFVDGSVLDLTANSKYYINEYHYQMSGGNDKSLSELILGGFRLLSGSIKQEPDNYNVKTPNAVIGLRGTFVEAQMDARALYVACTKGHVQIQNGAGTVVIGEGMEQYAVVTSSFTRPKIFISPPSNLIKPNVRQN